MSREHEIEKKYGLFIKHKRRFLWLAVIVTLLLGITGLALGPASISFRELLCVFTTGDSQFINNIILNIRLPRVLAGIVTGIALAVSGVVMQSILRNPLGSPFTLGISSSAAFGAAFAIIVFGAGGMYSGSSDAVIIANPYLVTISAFFWSLVACFLILYVAKRKGVSPQNMILTGIITGSLFSALTTGLQYVADDIELAAIVFWTFGDLSKGGWKELILQTIILLPVLIYFYRNRWNYNVLDAGDETAASLGVNFAKLRLTGMIAASLATATIVSFYGIIAFVGLVVPHMARRLIGNDERFLIPGAAISGAAFMVGCDIIARTIISPMVLPVGILTSVIGAPLFVLLLLRGKEVLHWK